MSSSDGRCEARAGFRTALGKKRREIMARRLTKASITSAFWMIEGMAGIVFVRRWAEM